MGAENLAPARIPSPDGAARKGPIPKSKYSIEHLILNLLKQHVKLYRMVIYM